VQSLDRYAEGLHKVVKFSLHFRAGTSWENDFFDFQEASGVLNLI
jgi:hypothetical protein